MRSAWFWGTDAWEQYQVEYWKGRERPEEYKTSPLADDAVLPGPNYDYDWTDAIQKPFELTAHKTQVVDVSLSLAALWSDVRPSYHSLIHRANERYEIVECQTQTSIWTYQRLHAEANGGAPRTQATYDHQWQWLKDGNGLLVLAQEVDNCAVAVAAAYWIVYKDCAYYMSGPSIERNVQHAVIWESICKLHTRGVCLAELGQIDGETEKERNVGHFKAGFGGTSVPFTVARRTA